MLTVHLPRRAGADAVDRRHEEKHADIAYVAPVGRIDAQWKARLVRLIGCGKAARRDSEREGRALRLGGVRVR